MSAAAEWNYRAECPVSESHGSFPGVDRNFNAEILYLDDFLCSWKILKIV